MKLPNANTLKKIFEALKDLVSDVNIDFLDNGMYIQAMDSSHVSLIEVNLLKESFERYDYTDGVTIGVNIENMLTILKCAKANDSLHMEFTDDEVVMTLESDRKCRFEMKLMDIDCERMHIPEQEYDVSFEMPSKELANLAKDLSTIGDTLKIKSTNDKVYFETSGDIGNASIEYDINNETELVAEYSLRYINSFCKAHHVSNNVHIGINDDMPMKLTFEMDDNGSSIVYYIAPKIED